MLNKNWILVAGGVVLGGYLTFVGLSNDEQVLNNEVGSDMFSTDASSIDADDPRYPSNVDGQEGVYKQEISTVEQDSDLDTKGLSTEDKQPVVSHEMEHRNGMPGPEQTVDVDYVDPVAVSEEEIDSDRQYIEDNYPVREVAVVEYAEADIEQQRYDLENQINEEEERRKSQAYFSNDPEAEMLHLPE